MTIGFAAGRSIPESNTHQAPFGTVRSEVRILSPKQALASLAGTSLNGSASKDS